MVAHGGRGWLLLELTDALFFGIHVSLYTKKIQVTSGIFHHGIP